MSKLTDAQRLAAINAHNTLVIKRNVLDIANSIDGGHPDSIYSE